MKFNTFIKHEEHYTLTRDIKDEWPTIDITKDPESGRLRVDGMELQRWRTKAELVEWLSYCASKIKEMP